jgi:hypothetical protein
LPMRPFELWLYKKPEVHHSCNNDIHPWDIQNILSKKKLW